jgi:hypothetical protein
MRMTVQEHKITFSKAAEIKPALYIQLMKQYLNHTRRFHLLLLKIFPEGKNYIDRHFHKMLRL